MKMIRRMSIMGAKPSHGHRNMMEQEPSALTLSWELERTRACVTPLLPLLAPRIPPATQKEKGRENKKDGWGTQDRKREEGRKKQGETREKTRKGGKREEETNEKRKEGKRERKNERS